MTPGEGDVVEAWMDDGFWGVEVMEVMGAGGAAGGSGSKKGQAGPSYLVTRDGVEKVRGGGEGGEKGEEEGRAHVDVGGWVGLACVWYAACSGGMSTLSSTWVMLRRSVLCCSKLCFVV